MRPITGCSIRFPTICRPGWTPPSATAPPSGRGQLTFPVPVPSMLMVMVALDLLPRPQAPRAPLASLAHRVAISLDPFRSRYPAPTSGRMTRRVDMSCGRPGALVARSRRNYHARIRNISDQAYWKRQWRLRSVFGR